MVWWLGGGCRGFSRSFFPKRPKGTSCLFSLLPEIDVDLFFLFFCCFFLPLNFPPLLSFLSSSSKIDKPKMDLAKIERAQNRLAKNGLGKNRLSRLQEGVSAKMGARRVERRVAEGWAKISFFFLFGSMFGNCSRGGAMAHPKCP